MRIHGNSNDSQKDQHLYAIYDREEEDVFKYGISEGEIEEDGYSKRVRQQVIFLNRAVGWFRYFAVIMMTRITGKRRARSIEDEHISRYQAKHGRKPRGNQ